MISIRNLCTSYDGEAVLHGVDADFPEGKISVLIGPNGCGKSTTVKSVMRLVPEYTGMISVGGVPLEDISQKDLAKKIAYVSQSRNVPDITVYNMVMHGRYPYLSYPRHYRKEDRDIVEAAIRMAGLEDFANRKLENLSGGQRQKAYMAMALAQDTEVIIMDEPTTFLDVKNQFEMMDHAKKLSDMGKTIIMILHDMEAVLHYADHVILMKDGRDVLSGGAEEVLRSKEVEEVFGIHTGFYETEDGLHIYLRS
ncbi:MAG: ABC transporter ATP-binding protein [Firmicutes bacterium]|nr:ABC transporter ATP-binding protein [Bacillota bacterium]